MKLKILVCVLVFLFALPLIAAPPQEGKFSGSNALTVDNTTLIDINRILMFVTNHGNFGRDLSGTFGYDYGTWYPYTGNIEDYSGHTVFANYTPNYASGLWIGAIDSATGELRTTISEYSSEYVPGPMSGGTFMPDQPEFRVYKLYKDSLIDNPNQDYIDYMAYAVPEQGAPLWTADNYIATYFDTISQTLLVDTLGEIGEPAVLGDQFLWSVYNDADPDQHGNMQTLPLGIEVKQALFAYKSDGPLGDIVFFRYRIFNNGNNTLDSCYFSLWCDPDLGSSGDDYVACDTLTSIGFVWNDNKVDQNYAPTAIPSMGFDFLQGPLVTKTDPSQPDAWMWDQAHAGMTNQGMTSFNKYINGTDPDDAAQAYNYMRGLTRTGGDYSYGGQVLKYVLSGDPVSGKGDIDVVSADRRWMQSTGPLTFRPGDSTEVIAAMVVGQAIDNKVSISMMRYNDRAAQNLYDRHWIAPKDPATPILNTYVDENSLTIAWTDTSEVLPGSYPFEGYLIYQGESKTGPWTKITAFDLINTIDDIEDEYFNPAIGFITGTYKNGEDAGVRRSITITEDIFTDKALINLTEYHYKVEAYTYDLNAQVGFKTLSSSATVSLVPELKVPDITYEYVSDDILPVTHESGVSDGVISPIVVNPDSLNGHIYRIEFADTLGIIIDTIYPDLNLDPPYDTLYDSTNIAWHLYDVTDGEYELMWQTNQSGDDDYYSVDGFTLKVAGPALGFKSFQCVANANGAIDPPESAGAPWYGYPVPTGVDPDGYVTSGQQVGEGAWMFATADNGGTNDGGNRGPYAKFLERVMRNDNGEDVGIYDFEMRFTAAGSYAIGAFEAAPEPVYTVPFELWRIGVGTPDDPSDDVRMLPWMIDADASNTYNLASWGDSDNGGGDYEHSISGGNNDPQTDWIYWIMPADDSPGQVGYDADVATLDLVGMTAGTYPWDGEETMARTVLVNWNGGSEPPFNQDLPEEGTSFRFVTGKPNAAGDVFTFTAPTSGMLAAKNEEMLDKIVTVPNPFYLNSAYNTNPGSYTLKFYHLPTVCTINIYNLSGELVRTIDKDDPSTSTAEWDVLTENGLPVASGIYIYVVDAPGYGQKIGKMAIFVQQEVLKIY